MIVEKQSKCANFLRIVAVLRRLLDTGKIDEKDYRRAKRYYQKMTGADIVIAD